MIRRCAFHLAIAFIVGVVACSESDSPSEPGNGSEAGQGASAADAGEPGGGTGGASGSSTTGGALPGGQSGAGESGTAGEETGGTGGGGRGGAGGAGARAGAGTGGAGASGGGGGSGGSGPPTDNPNVVARAAVVLGSCYPDDGVSRNAAELWHWQEEARFWSAFRLQAECIADAGGGCRALDSCLGWSLAESAGCDPGRTCDGSVFRDCIERTGYSNIEQSIDCATIGLECDPRGICLDGPGVDCDDETYVQTCEAGEPTSCPSVDVVISGPDCAELGLSCVADDLQTPDTVIARCVGAGAACENLSDALFDGVACAGDTLDACVNGRRQNFECATLGEGFSCQTHSGIPFCGLASECLPANLQGTDRDVPQGGIPEPACDGTSIVFCNAGRLERIDCTTLGFTGCDIEAGYGCVPSPRTELDP